VLVELDVVGVDGDGHPVSACTGDPIFLVGSQSPTFHRSHLFGRLDRHVLA